mgnify:CR=1 FL=1
MNDLTNDFQFQIAELSDNRSYINPQEGEKSSDYPAVPIIDFEALQPYFDGEDVSEEQKRELIELIFHVLMEYADIVFGLNPIGKACGKVSKVDTQREELIGDMLKTKHTENVSGFSKPEKEDNS